MSAGRGTGGRLWRASSVAEKEKWRGAGHGCARFFKKGRRCQAFFLRQRFFLIIPSPARAGRVGTPARVVDRTGCAGPTGAAGPMGGGWGVQVAGRESVGAMGWPGCGGVSCGAGGTPAVPVSWRKRRRRAAGVGWATGPPDRIGRRRAWADRIPKRAPAACLLR